MHETQAPLVYCRMIEPEGAVFPADWRGNAVGTLREAMRL